MLAAHLRRAEHVERDREELEADEQRSTVFCAPTSSDMPAIEVSSSAWNSPCAASRRRQRAPREQHRARAAGDEDHVQRRARGRRSRSAPATIDARAFHCQIVSPSAAPSATSASSGTTCSRTKREPQQADEQHEHRAAEQRDQRREAREVDVGASGGRWRVARTGMAQRARP